MLWLCVTFFCLLYGVKTGRKSIALIFFVQYNSYSALQKHKPICPLHCKVTVWSLSLALVVLKQTVLVS